MLWAYVPGASSDRRRNNGRLGSDSSSSVRSVVTCVARSARGKSRMVRAAETNPLVMPQSMRQPMAASGQPSANPSATVPTKNPAATTSTAM